ncbi:MAG: hypothetical protein KDC07_07220 [Chitinophagaceae bacterium]|nr:hypothetical protein [Chitinophagaceae bacterium]MCB9046656.1 hypothetical protein [Chitinophagales bacterium]
MRSLLLIAILSITTFTMSCTKKESTTISTTDDNPNNSNGNGDDNPGKDQTKLSYQLTATNTSSSLAKVTAGNIQWTFAVANPQQVKFEAKKGTTETEYKSSNSTPINLLTTTATSFGTFSIAAGTYTELELKILLNTNGNAPSLKLTGTFDNGNVSLPVEVIIEDLVELKTEQHNVDVTTSFDFTAITSISLSSLSTGITESAITGATMSSGTIMISKSYNKSLYDIILNNLANMKHHVEVETHHK